MRDAIFSFVFVALAVSLCIAAIEKNRRIENRAYVRHYFYRVPDPSLRPETDMERTMAALKERLR